jgi:hypothetical protein
VCLEEKGIVLGKVAKVEIQVHHLTPSCHHWHCRWMSLLLALTVIHRWSCLANEGWSLRGEGKQCILRVYVWVSMYNLGI